RLSYTLETGHQMDQRNQRDRLGRADGAGEERRHHETAAEPAIAAQKSRGRGCSGERGHHQWIEHARSCRYARGRWLDEGPWTRRALLPFIASTAAGSLSRMNASP